MALTELNFEFKPGSPKTLVDEWSHVGVVSSGDLEVLIEKGNAYEGKAVIRVMTTVLGFDSVWETVLKRIVETTGLSSVKVSINDNAATPAVVKRRMQQAIANGGGLQ
ncbi:MAG: malonate decarboxylase acyl carrier protein [Candidatus Methanofastidiosa archaeon]|nr:malonate decarboxylase acyl carrier protein [Candidatus Methanofastidiosa archaeon]MDD4280967.1 malonate decarboxylase acyl carrier protein [Candidatus Methanofastidiosa archaeon]